MNNKAELITQVLDEISVLEYLSFEQQKEAFKLIISLLQDYPKPQPNKANTVQLQVFDNVQSICLTCELHLSGLCSTDVASNQISKLAQSSLTLLLEI